jgi:hypothetical protein
VLTCTYISARGGWLIFFCLLDMLSYQCLTQSAFVLACHNLRNRTSQRTCRTSTGGICKVTRKSKRIWYASSIESIRGRNDQSDLD